MIDNPENAKARTSAIDRREAMKWIIGGTAAITATVAGITLWVSKNIPVPSMPFDRVDRTVGGKRAAPIPDSWHRTLERISVGSAELSKANINTLAREMQPIDYSRVCNSNPGLAMPTTKYGMSLPEAMDYVRKGHIADSGAIGIGATDGYTLVTYPGDGKYDYKKAHLSISTDNIPKEFQKGENFERARKARVTYPGVFFPEEQAKAWKDLVDVNEIYSMQEEIKPGTYFRDPYGRIIMPEHDDVSMNLDSLVLMIGEKNNMRLRIYYSDFQEVAEHNPVMSQKHLHPALNVHELMLYANIDPKNKALVFHANNYAVCVPPWRQKDLSIIIDPKNENRHGVPTKLIGGEFLNKAAQVNGVYRIEAVPI